MHLKAGALRREKSEELAHAVKTNMAKKATTLNFKQKHYEVMHTKTIHYSLFTNFKALALRRDK